MSVAPLCSYHWTWWMWHWSKAASQPSIAHVRYIARSTQTLVPVRSADGTPGAEYDAVVVDGERCQSAVAEQAPDRLGWDGSTIAGLADAAVVELAGERGPVVDHHRHVGFQGTGAIVTACDEPAERLRCQAVAVVRTVDELGLTAALAGGDHGRNLAIDRAEDLVGELGMEREVAFRHPGRRIEEA